MRLSSIISLVASSALALADASLRELAKDFPIGVAANSWKFSDETYVETLSQFNTMVAENACKFKAIQREQGVWNFDECDAHYQKAVELGQKFRGHCLLWFNYQPKWFQEITDADVMEKTIVEHITNVLDHYRGKIDTWDVVNEAIEDTATGENGTWELRDCNLTNVLPNYIDIAFKTAREVDPTVKLFYNDYEIEGDDIHEGKKTNAVYNLVKDMVERGVPIDGVGIQYHLHTDKPVKYENVMKTIARFGELGLEVQITEMDVNSVEGKTEESFALQAKLYREGLKACLDSPNCTAFLIWGVSDADSWRRNGYPLIFNTDYTPKPAYYALIDVLKEYNGIENDAEVLESVINEPENEVAVDENENVDDADDSSDSDDENVLKIMTIGDSITFGLAETGGYRKYLNYFLKEKGYTNVDFVGPEGDEVANFTYNGEVVTYDDNHAGYSGFTIMQQPDSWSDDSGLYEKLISKDAIKKYQPDIVLLIIGTNDMTANRSMEDCEKDLHTLLDYILGDLPSTSMIFIGSIPEYILYGGTPEKVANYNKTVKKVADDYTASGKNVEFADIHGCLDGVNDLSDDDIHPSGAGYEKMGKFWADVIDDYLTCEDDEEIPTDVTEIPSEIPEVNELPIEVPTEDVENNENDENVLKIMTIGDSITFGLAETGGYRKYLNYFLKEKGYTGIDFVGPEGDEEATFTYNGEVVTYDDNHAGYSGFTIMQQPDSWSDDSGLYEKLISKDAIKKYQPDIVLLIIGTNDMTANRSMEDCEKDLHTLLDYILGDLPSTSMIFIGSIPEYILYGGTPEKVANYNKTVKKVADDYTASGKNVEFADIHGCLDGVNDLSDDDIHPSGAGYEKMGKFWADVIDDYLTCEDEE